MSYILGASVVRDVDLSLKSRLGALTMYGRIIPLRLTGYILPWATDSRDEYVVLHLRFDGLPQLVSEKVPYMVHCECLVPI